MESNKSILVMSAHAADFVWRAGGAIALYAERLEPQEPLLAVRQVANRRQSLSLFDYLVRTGRR